MAANSIGSAALVLTTEASGLTNGLKKAGNDIGKFKDKADKETSKMGAGLKAAGLLVAVYAIAKGIGSVTEYLGEMSEAVKTGAMSFGKIDDQKILQAGFAVDLLKAKFMGMVNRIMIILSPLIELIADKLSQALAALSPIIQYVARIFTAAYSIWVEIMAAVVEAVWDVVTAIAHWVSSITGLGETTQTVESVVLTVFKVLVKGAALVWDTLKLGAGAIAYVASFIVEGFGKIVDAFKETIKELLGIAGTLPDYLGGKMFRDAAADVDKWGGKLKAVGEDMRKWGKGTFNNFGKSLQDVDAWFAKIMSPGRGGKLKADVMLSLKYEPSAAALKGSKEAYSIETKFLESSKLNSLDIQKQQLELAKKGVVALNQINESLKAKKPEMVI